MAGILGSCQFGVTPAAAVHLLALFACLLNSPIPDTPIPPTPPHTHTDGVYAVAWSPVQADLVATGGADDRAFIWRVGQEAFEATGGAVLQLEGHSDTVCALAFSGDGAMLAR